MQMKYKIDSDLKRFVGQLYAN